MRILLLLAVLGLASTAAASALQPATVSPDGKTRFYWSNPYDSGSIQQDGLHLVVRNGQQEHTLVEWMLTWRDYLSWCGSSLVAVAGGDRFTTDGKRLVVAAPPYRRTRPLTRGTSLSWVTPTCAPDGRSLVASAGRSFVERRFGQEHRSLWLLSLDGARRRRLSHAPAGRSDEAACFSGDGATIYFVRSGPTDASGSANGRLFALRLADRRLTALERLAPAANVFGHYAWPSIGRCGG
jgi:Tol biopolymer transport system component